MRSSLLWRALGFGAVAVGSLAAVTVAAVPTAAQTPPPILTVAGSDTTDQMMAAITNTANGQYNVRAQQTTPLAVPGDAGCAALTYAFPGTGPGQTPSPNGSSAGRNALRGSVQGTYPNGTAGAGRGCVDIARSSSEPRGIDPVSGDLSTFEYYAFAIDGMMWASPSLQAPGSITLQQAIDIWQCDITNWSQLPGGGTGQIQRVAPQSSSGTFQSFSNNLLAGVPPAAAEPGCPAVVSTQESTGKDPAFTNPSNPQFREQAFMAYSMANWSFQANSAANPTLDVRNGVRPLGIRYGAADVRYSVIITGALQFRLNSAFVSPSNPNFNTQTDHSVMPGVRRVYNVIDSTSPSYSAARNFVGFDDLGTAKSPLCGGAHASIILSAGFLPLPAATSPGGNPGVTCIKRTP